MKVIVNGQLFDPEDGDLVIVHLKPRDRENIRDMPEDASLYSMFDEGHKVEDVQAQLDYWKARLG